MMQVENVCAAILAGGASRRMGTAKALIEVAGQPLIARIAQRLRPMFTQVVVVTGSDEIARAARLPRVEDEYADKGPLAGIHAALKHFQNPTFCVACDMPYLDTDFIRFLIVQHTGFDAVVPRCDGHAEPLHALYAPSCLSLFESELKNARVAPMQDILRRLNVRWIKENEIRAFGPNLFENWNTPADVTL